MGSLLILGFGNTLMGDDGAGLAVVRRLVGEGLPPGVRCVEERSDSLQISARWRGERAVWLVDAIIRGEEPGNLHILDEESIMAIPQRHATVHHLSLPEALRLIRHACPEMTGVTFTLYGIEPGRVSPGLGISPAVERAVQALAGKIYQEAEAFVCAQT